VNARIALGVIVLGLAVFSWVAAPSSQQLAADSSVSFTADIQPILQRTCWTCHGTAFQLSNLDLRTRDGALKGGNRGPALVPGNAEGSPLYRFVAGLDQPSMPLDGGALPAAQVAAIKAWIDQGAHWDAGPGALAATADDPFAALKNTQLPADARDYWAFTRPVQAPVPNVGAALTNPIDRFLEKTRQDRGLQAAPRADRLTLLRRASLDLIGLPPSPAEIDAFLADTAPGAWERVIDRLLASPHYGERWAATGSTWPATPTRAASRTTRIGRTSGDTATTSSSRSTPTSPTTCSSRNRSRATSLSTGRTRR
jgi:hypothetical protein